MGVAKVNYNDETLIDLTADTVTADTLRLGETAHDAEGNAVTGTYTPPTVQLSKTAEITENGSHTIQPDEGYTGMGTVTANVNVPATPKTASGSITHNITAGSNTFTLGTVSFTPIACGWYFNESECRGMATKDTNGTSHGVGVNTGTRVSTFTYTPKVTVNGGTITGSCSPTYAARNATISWWAVGS